MLPGRESPLLGLILLPSFESGDGKGIGTPGIGGVGRGRPMPPGRRG